MAETVDEFVTMWLEDVKTRTKPQTAERYEGAYRRDIAPELGGMELDQVTRSDIKRLVAKKLAGGAGAGTLGMLARVLSIVFSQAYDEGRIAANPAERLRRTFSRGEEPLQKAMTAEELVSFLRALETEPVYRALFRTMAFTGLRIGEARALRVEDADFGELRLHVRRTFSGGSDFTCTPKTGRARRVEMPYELALELEALTRGQNPGAWLFSRHAGEARRGGEPIGDWAAREAFRRVRRRAGLPKHLTPHSLRHTYASLLLQHGARTEYVQRQLGHRSITMTVNVYGSWLPLSARKELDELVAAVAPSGIRVSPSVRISPKILQFSVARSIAKNQPFSAKSNETEDTDPKDAA